MKFKISVPFEPPLKPEAIVDTGRLSPQEATLSVIQHIDLAATHD